jgi:hypothetical protein
MSVGLRGRLIAGVVGMAMLIGVGVVPSISSTEAAWARSEHVASAFTAYDVPEPISSTTPGCTASGLLNLSPSVTIRWRVPPGVAGYSIANTEFGHIQNQGLIEPILSNLLQNVTTTGTAEGYVTTIGGTLLANLLGGKKTLGIRFVGPGGWKSDWLVAVAEFGALGIGNRCSMTTAPSA